MTASFRVDTLPHVQAYKYDDWPESREGVLEMEFRLVYQGRLPAASQTTTRSKQKHEIRKTLHKQLATLWSKDSELKGLQIENPRWTDHGLRANAMERIADNYARCGYRFLPLVTKAHALACALDILFLRRDRPGDLVRSGGDIDNRIKVLFDALRMPQECRELADYPVPDADENPFFCLLEDDSLITELKITTDRLLLPAAPDEHESEVVLVVLVRTLHLRSDGIYSAPVMGSYSY